MSIFRDRRVRVLTQSELAPAYLRDLRNFTARKRVSRHRWPDTMLNWVIQTETRFCNAAGDEIELPFHIFYPSDEDIEAFRAEAVERRIAEWFETIICCPVPDDITPRLRPEGVLRMLVVASYVRARHPYDEMRFGLRPANDNSAIPPDAPEPRA